MKPETVKRIGWIASGLSLLMYVSYIAQIYSNLHGVKGNFIQPLVATANCLIWTIYGFSEKPKQWPVIIANVPGIFLAAITVFTCF